MDKRTIVVPDPAEIEPKDIGAVMAQMAAIQLSLATRLVAEGADRVPDEGDKLLTVDEAAARLKCSSDWLYRRAKRLPFIVRVGRNLRFSERGIEEAIRSGCGLLDRGSKKPYYPG
jgi:excisionase family DNA binding protein